MIIPSLEISHRVDFPVLLNERGLTGFAVEVGTDQGAFAREFLSRWRGQLLLCVDPYTPYDERRWDRRGDLMQAVAATSQFHGRVRFVVATSEEAFHFIPHYWRPFDFVYIDGSHDRLEVGTDLSVGWESLSDHGILAGHDFDDTHPGVVRAVTEFADARGLTVRLTHEPLASWYIYKTEPEFLIKQFWDTGKLKNERQP